MQGLLHQLKQRGIVPSPIIENIDIRKEIEQNEAEINERHPFIAQNRSRRFRVMVFEIREPNWLGPTSRNLREEEINEIHQWMKRVVNNYLKRNGFKTRDASIIVIQDPKSRGQKRLREWKNIVVIHSLEKRGLKK